MLRLALTTAQKAELSWLERRGEPAHLREKAHALLLIGEGQCAVEVARQRLLRPRQPDTVRHWIHRYAEQGVAGLRVQEGRGRKSLPF